MLYTTIDSPIGELLLLGDGSALHGLYMQEAPKPMALEPDWRADPGAFADVRRQLAEYFGGDRTAFDVPLAAAGTPFQTTVWRGLQDIPYGETVSYGELAGRATSRSPSTRRPC